MIAEATASNLVVTVEGSIIDFVGGAVGVEMLGRLHK